MVTEKRTCVGPCEREFTLNTQTQIDRGMTDKGWMCPTCRFNHAGKELVGFVERSWK